jgi:hypothetical protein
MNVCCQFHAMATLPPAKEPRYLLGRRPGDPQSQSGRHGEEIHFLPLPEIEPRLPSPHYTDTAIPAHTFLNKRADIGAGFFRILPKERYSHSIHLVLKMCSMYGST